jgi:hypothetical protein
VRSLRTLLLSFAALAPGIAGADDFTDFRIPPNRALLWTAGLHAGASRRDGGGNWSGFEAGALSSDLSSDARWSFDSDPVYTSLAASASASGDRSHGTSDAVLADFSFSSSTHGEDSRRALSEYVLLTATHRRYPWAEPIGFEGDLTLTGFYSQSWLSSSYDRRASYYPGYHVRTIDSQYEEQWEYSPSVAASASVGWGRVRNATGIYDALVLERRLRESGALTRPLSGEGRRRLARLLYARDAFETAHDRPARSLWREIERLLGEDGALGERGLDPYSVLRAAEPHVGGVRTLTRDGIPVSPVSRQTGAFVGARLVDRHAHNVVRDDRGAFREDVVNDTMRYTVGGVFASRYTASYDVVEAGIAGEIHRPIGPRWQLDATGEALLGLREQDNHLRFQSRLSVAWMVADRWTATATAFHRWNDYYRNRGPTPGDWAFWDLTAGVSYYLEDHVAIVSSAHDRQSWFRGRAAPPPPSPQSRIFDRDLAVSLDITYRFAGWFAAAAFFPAAGPAPGAR